MQQTNNNEESVHLFLYKMIEHPDRMADALISPPEFSSLDRSDQLAESGFSIKNNEPFGH